MWYHSLHSVTFETAAWSRELYSIKLLYFTSEIWDKNKGQLGIHLKVVVQTEVNDFGMYSENLLNDVWHAYKKGKLVGNEENNIPPSSH